MMDALLRKIEEKQKQFIDSLSKVCIALGSGNLTKSEKAYKEYKKTCDDLSTYIDVYMDCTKE